jgi:hypothetical protein
MPCWPAPAGPSTGPLHRVARWSPTSPNCCYGRTTPKPTTAFAPSNPTQSTLPRTGSQSLPTASPGSAQQWTSGSASRTTISASTRFSLTADYLAKVEEEKEQTRAQRERLREEEAARRDFERERTRLTKERSHYAGAVTRLQQSGGSPQALADIEAKLNEIDGEMDKVLSREAKIRAGYVYVISNIGAFGARMVKIGLTRRLEPMDRVRELGDASVPFRFDVHACIFSDDAVTLETRLLNGLPTGRSTGLTTHVSSSTPPRLRSATF